MINLSVTVKQVVIQAANKKIVLSNPTKGVVTVQVPTSQPLKTLKV